MWIFDRWGAMIYYTGDIRKGWDGSIKGKNEPAKQDVYVWKVNITDVTGKKHRYVGHVTLLP
jgi:gliding motility-associated-like protein